MLLPALSMSRKKALSLKCLSNLKQLGTLAALYTTSYQEFFPPSQDGSGNNWDTDSTGGSGLLYESSEYSEIQMCPGMDVNISADRFTGYNYNTTYVGHGRNETPEAPAKIGQIKRPERCVLFGDGGSVLGTALVNKFMRAPFGTGRLGSANPTLHPSGAQGYRHLRATNVCFADGHSDTISYINPAHYDPGSLLPPLTGFISFDDDLYDLD